MKVTDIIAARQTPGFSFEVLPPLKGRGINQLFKNIDILCEFDPLYINITTHRSEIVFKDTSDGLYRRVSERSRPGTVAVAAAIQQKYGIPAVPHMICSGFSKIETEYALIDLNFLGITNLLLLRGDKAKHESRFTPNADGHAHASELQQQVNDFNRGYFIDGTKMDIITGETFSYGVAGYPEKHEESPNPDIDLQYLKLKVDNGADYIVTQMFFDNEKYFSFVERCRAAGINVPIIPGLKPISKMSHLTMLPKVFRIDIPEELASRIRECKTDTEVKQVGIEWGIRQSRELLEKGAPGLHYYTMSVSDSVSKIVENVY